jgi:hypothetical protein
MVFNNVIFNNISVISVLLMEDVYALKIPSIN